MSTVTPSLSAGLAQLKALTEFIDQGDNNATFAFYSDTKPMDTTVLPDESKRLVTMTFPKPSFKITNMDSVELNQTDAAVVLKDGDAVWGRLYNGSGLAVADFTVGDHITLNNPQLVLGSTLMLNSIILGPQ